MIKVAVNINLSKFFSLSKILFSRNLIELSFEILWHIIFHIAFLLCFALVFLLLIMDNYFNDTDFESGMCFLVDTLTDCIDNNIYGFINKRNQFFSVQFVFTGLKTTLGKRKSHDGFDCVLTKMRKLNTSLESLNLDSKADCESIDFFSKIYSWNVINVINQNRVR